MKILKWDKRNCNNPSRSQKSRRQHHTLKRIPSFWVARNTMDGMLNHNNISTTWYSKGALGNHWQFTFSEHRSFKSTSSQDLSGSWRCVGSPGCDTEQVNTPTGMTTLPPRPSRPQHADTPPTHPHSKWITNCSFLKLFLPALNTRTTPLIVLAEWSG